MSATLVNQRRSARRLGGLRERIAGAESHDGSDPTEQVADAEPVRRALAGLSEGDREVPMLVACASTSSTTGCGLPAGRPFGGERPTGSSRHRSLTPSSPSSLTTVTYLVDARTYLPLEVRQRSVIDDSDVPDGGRERLSATVGYLRYEALPVTDANKRLLQKGAGRDKAVNAP